MLYPFAAFYIPYFIFIHPHIHILAAFKLRINKGVLSLDWATTGFGNNFNNSNGYDGGGTMLLS